MTAAGERTRRAREREAAAARHRGLEAAENFSAGFAALAQLAIDGSQVSARAVDLLSGRVLFSVDDHIVLPTAGIGKVLLLLEVAARLSDGSWSRYDVLDRTDSDLIGGAGVWQHLHVPALPLADLAAIVGSTSDNVATNILLRRVGLDAVRQRAESLGITKSALLDVVRERRGPDDAPQLSVGSTAELAWLFARIARGEAVDASTSYKVADWLALGADLTLVASAFGLDPLAHTRSDHSLTLFNQTGTDTGIRCEVGVLRGPRAGVAYAVTVVFADKDISTRLEALGAMRTIGTDLLEYVH
ncbi:serine hydrolase [Naasia lichenicola]|uniref:serine hydrolase n=1 Tax=Naasia lichenicola TaxID=2565933 RepID=UPI001E419F33|nr:serine hydrolase [Naasia lichenicola]